MYWVLNNIDMWYTKMHMRKMISAYSEIIEPLAIIGFKDTTQSNGIIYIVLMDVCTLVFN